MLKVTQNGLQEEINAAVELRDAHVRTLATDELAICGLHYGDNESRQVPDDPENHAQTWLRQFLTENTLSSPKVLISANGQEWPEDRAGLLEAACNRMAEQANLKHTFHRCGTDYGLRAAQAVCSVEPADGYEDERDPPWVCKASRLAFDEYVHDPSVLDRGLGAWEAHRMSRPIADVIHEAENRPELGWDITRLREMAAKIDADARKAEQKSKKVERRDLVWWPLWERHGKVEKERTGRKGYFGSVHYVLDKTMPTAGLRKMIRRSDDWFGHKAGPYAIGAAMWIGDLPIGLAPLVATHTQAEWTNIVAKALMMAIATYKNITGTTDADAAQRMRESKNGDVVEFGGMDIRQVAGAFESGGASQQFIVAFQLALESLQRNAGTYQNRQGQVDAQATATAILDAQSGYQSAMAFWSDGFRDWQKQIMERWAFWGDLHPKVRVRVGPIGEDVRAALARQLGRDPGLFVDVLGGLNPGSNWSAFDHDMLDLRISAFSGRQQNEQSLMQDFQFMLGALQGLAAMPPQLALAMDTQKYLNIAARARGIRDLDRLIDPNLFRAITASMLQMQQAPTARPNSARPQLAIGGGSKSQPANMPASGPREMKIAGPKSMPGSPSGSAPRVGTAAR